MSIKSELTKTASYLRSARKAILGRGGEISLTAGLKDLPEAIYKIPADASLAYYTDDSIAYKKTVPTGAEEYAQINKVGGMTYKSDNLLCYPYAEKNKTSAGITFTANIDGSITINGTNDGTNNSIFHISKLDNNPLHLTAGQYTASIGNANVICIVNKGTSYLWGTFTIDNKGEYAAYIQIAKGTTTTFSNVKIYPMLNEGDTALPYELGFEGVRDSKVTEIKSYGKNLYYGERNLVLDGTTKSVVLWEGNINEPVTFSFKTNLEYRNPNGASTIRLTKADGSIVHATSYNSKYTAPNLTKIQFVNWAQDIGTYYDIQLEYGSTATDYVPYKEPTALAIPEEIQAIEGYGKGVNDNCYNYIDFERKTFHKKLGKVDLGTLDWVYYADYDGFYTFGIQSLVNKSGGKDSIIVAGFENVADSVFNSSPEVDRQITLNIAGSIKLRMIGITEPETLKTNLSGVMLYYELATPEEIDISEYLTGDNFIQVEGGGTLTFENEHKNAVPSTIKYVQRVGS